MNGSLETALKLYAEHLGNFIVRTLKEEKGAGRGWVEAYVGALSEGRRKNYVEDLKRGKTPEEAVDLAHFKDVLLGNREVFKRLLGRSYNRLVTWADEIQEVRNKWAHQKEIPPDDLYRALDNIARALMAIGAEEAAATVKALRDGMKNVVPAQKDEEPASRLGGVLKPWWIYAEPHADIKRGDFDENTFAAKLDDVVAGRASPEYLFADEFFQKTHLTRELRSLLTDTLKRLAGTGGEAVVQLRTPFGGGKTHALIALYHLVKDSATTGTIPEIQELLKDAGLKDIPRARVAVLVGTSLHPLGRKTEEGQELKTLWGELAYQLGGEEGYALVAEADQQRVAPGKETLVRLLKKHAPALILMDEILLYLVKAAGVQVGSGTLQGQTFAFLQELTEAVGSVDGVALLTTFPESHLEYFETDEEKVEAAFARLEKIFSRVQAVRVPVQGEEIYEVVRRRLFSKIDHGFAEKIAAIFHQHYRDQGDAPDEVQDPRYRELMKRAYPFHPELIRVLYERWGTIQDFQKTRGVLQLLARIVEQSYKSPLARPVIGPGDVHLENPDLRAAVLKPLGREAKWESVVASDILGKARELDERIGGDYKKHRLAQSTATAIFMYSHSGGGKDGVTKPWLDVVLTTPEGPSKELVSDALDRLQKNLFYLYENGTWIFRAQPNLNAVLNNELALVDEAKAIERLRDYVQKVAGRGAFRPIFWPRNHKDVPDDTTLKLAIYGPEYADETPESKRARDVVQQNAPGGPRVNKNTLIHLFMAFEEKPGLIELAKQEIALENIEKRSTSLALNEEQREELAERLRRVRAMLPERTRAAYSELYEPISGKGNFRYRKIKHVVQSEATLVAAVESVLRSDDRLLSKLDPALITHGAPPLWPKQQTFLPVDELRSYFYRLPELPMLESDRVLEEAIIEGVRIGLFELAVKEEDGYRLLYWSKDPPTRIHFQPTYALVRPGTLPKPRQTDELGTENVGDGLGLADDARPDTSPLTSLTRQEQSTRLVLRLHRVQDDQVPVLLDLIGALRDAGGEVRLEVEVVAEAAKRFDENVLELTVREVLEQSGFDYEWIIDRETES